MGVEPLSVFSSHLIANQLSHLITVSKRQRGRPCPQIIASRLLDDGPLTSSHRHAPSAAK
jgi:hypothetical protein